MFDARRCYCVNKLHDVVVVVVAGVAQDVMKREMELMSSHSSSSCSPPTAQFCLFMCLHMFVCVVKV
jgi:hypothetical protein